MDNFFGSLFGGFSKAYTGLEDWVGGLFAFSGKALPIEQIANIIDPRFLPQVSMSGDNIDIDTRMKLSQHGFKNAKLMTAQSHPEFYAHWATLCSRAGFPHPMQMILCESDIPNAVALSASEMAISTALLKHMTFREVCAIVSHELGHANNFEKQQAQHAAAAGGFSLLGVLLPWPSHVSWRSNLLSAFGIAAVGNITGSKIAGYATELEADFEGAIISHDPEALMSALTKLDGQLDTLPKWRHVMGKIFAIHPATEERVKWLQEVKQQLDVAAPLAPTLPTMHINGGQTAVERVSTNSPETAISGA
jgi:heat shock protein HtpX